MRNALLKATPWVGLAAIGLVTLLIVWTREPTPAGEATSTLEPSKPTAPAESPPPPAAALSRKSKPTAYGPNDKPAPLTAEQLTERAKAQLALDPAAALNDIEQADKLAGPEDETRRVLEIHALVSLGKVGMARSLTDRFYRNFPNSDRAVELERLTGYHPRPTHP